MTTHPDKMPSPANTIKLGRDFLDGVVGLGWILFALHSLEILLDGDISNTGLGMSVFSPIGEMLSAWIPDGVLRLTMCITHPAEWTAPDFLRAFVMWLSMVLAMMVPGLRALFSAPAQTAHLSLLSTAKFTAGYILAWALISVIFVAMQWQLQRLHLVDTYMVLTHGGLAAIVLLAAGLFQLTQTKSRLLDCCNTELARVRILPASAPFFTDGLKYAVTCGKCCWLLMAVMFVFGLMNVIAMAVLAVTMLAEKASKHRQIVRQLSGIVLIMLGAGYAL